MYISRLLLSVLLSTCIHASQLPLGQIMEDPYVPVSQDLPTLSDILTITRSGSIFGDYLRSVDSLSARLSSGSARSTVLLPTNKAVLALARKPHQGPAESEKSGDVEISEEDQDKALNGHVSNWVSAHIIPASPISLSSGESFPTLLDGVNVTFKEVRAATEDWEHYVLEPNNTKILEKHMGSNGVLYLIEGTVNY